MSGYEDELYADCLSDIIDQFSESDEESDNDSNVIRGLGSLHVPEAVYSDDNNSDEEQLEWSQTDCAPDVKNFIGQSEIQVPSSNLDMNSSLDLFLGDQLLNIFVTETNRYYHQQTHDSEPKKSKNWTDIDITEMKKFLGLLILMGFVKKTDRDEYWSTNPLLSTPIFGNTMTRSRFRLIWRYWHFSNNENCHNRMDKVKPVITYLTERFQSVYKPGKHLLLHDNIIPWRGKLSLRTYNSTNIMKYGILVRMVCDAVSGYICNFEVHCAQDVSLDRSIISVLSPYLNSWHDVYMDNYCNTITVAEELLKLNTNVCGIIEGNKGVPQCLRDINLKDNSTVFRRKDKILVQAWKTTRGPLYMISTMHSANTMETTHPKTRKKVQKPVCLIEYNKYVKGAERADQHLSYFSMFLKSRKWTKKTVLYLLNCALFNAYQVYRTGTGKNIRFKKYLLGVISSWLDVTIEKEEAEEGTSVTYTKRAPKHDPVDRLCPKMKKHKIVQIIGRGQVKNPRRACRICTSAKKRSSTGFMCASCNVPLHAGICFETYHTKLKY